jgi:hypothetical protein
MMGFSLLLAKSFLVPGISDSAEVPLGALGQDLVPETAPRQLRFRDVSSPKIYRGDLVFSLMISFLSGHKPYIYKVYICSSLAKPLNTINFFNVVCTLLFCFGIQTKKNTTLCLNQSWTSIDLFLCAKLPIYLDKAVNQLTEKYANI